MGQLELRVILHTMHCDPKSMHKKMQFRKVAMAHESHAAGIELRVTAVKYHRARRANI
jgi:hypothetical protein